MGNPSPRRIAGKLENYQIIVAMEPITAPTIGKLCFKFVHGGFFWGGEAILKGRVRRRRGGKI